MKVYKQWHDEKMNFCSETMVYFSQCTENKVLSLHELLKMTSDIATEDFNQRDMSTHVLRKYNYAFLVSRTAFRFHRMPKENEEIVLETWEEKNDPLQFVRAYEIRNKDGEKLVSGLSKWILIDTELRKILPVKNYTLRPPVSFVSEHDCLSCGKIIVPENISLIGEHKVGYSDIDANGHTNNSRYAAFMMDCLPSKYHDIAFTDFRINFSKEAMIGEVLKIYAAFEDDNKKITVVGKVGDSVSFESELYW